MTSKPFRPVDAHIAAAYRAQSTPGQSGAVAMRTILFAAILAIGANVAAHEYKASSLEIRHPWARATPKGAAVAGGYMTIINRGDSADRLVGGSSPAAGKFEIHEMKMEQGVMKMRPLDHGLEIKGGATVEFKPGSYHIMFMNLKAPFEQGQRVKGTLIFEKAGPVEVEYTVEAIGATPPAADQRGHGGQHGGQHRH
jgi:periplasmic copper chaperone A